MKDPIKKKAVIAKTNVKEPVVIEVPKENSDFLRLNRKDVIKSAIMTLGSFVLASIEPVVTSGNMNSHQIVLSAKIGLISGVVYLVKNLFSGKQI